MYPLLNIHNSFTRSHPSEEETPKLASVNGPSLLHFWYSILKSRQTMWSNMPLHKITNMAKQWVTEWHGDFQYNEKRMEHFHHWIMTGRHYASYPGAMCCWTALCFAKGPLTLEIFAAISSAIFVFWCMWTRRWVMKTHPHLNIHNTRSHLSEEENRI
jgi:hypothetical protein